MKHNQMRAFVLTALLIALVLLLGLTPVGMIPLGFINISILGVPVVIGTLLLGLKTGLILGFCFGTISALSAFGIYGTPSALAAALVAANPLLAILMCYVPRLLVPVVALGVYKFVKKRNADRETGAATHGRAVVGTLVYLLAAALVLWRTDSFAIWYVDVLIVLSAVGAYVLLSRRREAVALAAVAGSLTNTVFYLGLMLLFYIIAGINSEKVLVLVTYTGLIAGALEAIANAVVTMPVLSALRKIEKK